MHELVILLCPFDKSQPINKLPRELYNASVKYIRVNQGTAENIVTITGIVIPPLTQVTISFGIAKSLREWEKYPNDPARGFNIM